MADWTIPFDQLAAKANKRIEDVVRLSTIEVFKRVILRTPVDTGRARGNWVSSYQQPKTTFSNQAKDLSGEFTIRGMRGDVMAYPVGGIMFLCNSLPYIMALEYGLYPDPPIRGSKKRGESGYTIHTVGGYSMQAPSGMVRVTVIEFDAAVRKLIQSGADAIA